MSITSTSQFLQQYNVTMDQAVQFVAAELSSPQKMQELMDVCKAAGISSSMLTDIVDYALPQVTQDQVMQFFSGHGIDAAQLDIGGSAQATPRQTIDILETVKENILSMGWPAILSNTFDASSTVDVSNGAYDILFDLTGYKNYVASLQGDAKAYAATIFSTSVMQIAGFGADDTIRIGADDVYVYGSNASPSTVITAYVTGAPTEMAIKLVGVTSSTATTAVADFNATAGHGQIEFI